MIVFEGDWVNLGKDDSWLEVVSIITSMHVGLSNGQIVEASETQIKCLRSANEMKAAA